LSNGVRVVTESLPGRKSISVGFWVDVGSRDETDEIQGCSHFIEHMLFKGTEHRSSEEISRAIEEKGGYLNAFTDRDFTCFTAQVLDRDIELAIDVISDMLQTPLLRDEDMERERTVVLEEISRRDDSPESLMHDLFVERVWGGNLAAHPVLGTRDTIKSLSRSGMYEYFRQHYTPNRIVVSAAGNVDHERFTEALEKNLNERTSGTSARRVKPKYNRSLGFMERDMSQVQLCLTMEGAAFADRSWYALVILSSYLGEGASSKLFQEVREKRGLVYSISSQNITLKDAGLFAIFAGTSRDNAEEVVSIILRELARVRDENISADELERIIHRVEGELSLQMESSRSRMYGLGVSTLRLGRAQTTEEIIRNIRSVTLNDMGNLCQRILDLGKISTIALGLPKENAEKIESKLA
jgi:predicted Zn-dependent peptidase